MLRRALHRLTALLLILTPLPASAQPIAVGGTTQLLVDDHIVAKREGLERRQSTPGPGRVVLAGDQPWEQRVFYPEVMRRPDGRIMMFYNAGLTRAPMLNVVSLAESRDGLTFTKPRLGFFEEDGQPTNILYRDAHGPGIVRDPHAGDGERYKMAYFEGHKTLAVAFAGEDLRFRPSPLNPLATYKADTKQGVVWDPASRKWLWFTRIWEKPMDGRIGWSHFKGEIRSIARFESSDFVHWSGPEVVLRRSASDPELLDFYGMHVIVRHGVMIGLLWTSDWADDRGRVGRQRAELVVSRDSGRSWTRVDASHPFLELGASGSFDSHIVWPSGLLTVGDKDLIFYLGANAGHGLHRIEEFPRDKYRIGVREIGRDRFAGLAAGAATGTLSTKPLGLRSRWTVSANAVIEPGGEMIFWWSNAAGKPISSRKRLGPGDGLASPVTWSTAERHRVAGAAPILNISMRNATIYALSFH